MEQLKEMDRAVLEMQVILKLIPQNLYLKIPKNMINAIYSYSNDNYKFEYDFSKDLSEQNLSNKTRDFIAFLDYNYWADDITKKELEEAWAQNTKEKNMKYSYENLFNNTTKVEKSSKEILVIEKESIFKKIINKIISIFKKN